MKLAALIAVVLALLLSGTAAASAQDADLQRRPWRRIRLDAVQAQVLHRSERDRPVPEAAPSAVEGLGRGQGAGAREAESVHGARHGLLRQPGRGEGEAARREQRRRLLHEGRDRLRPEPDQVPAADARPLAPAPLRRQQRVHDQVAVVVAEALGAAHHALLGEPEPGRERAAALVRRARSAARPGAGPRPRTRASAGPRRRPSSARGPRRARRASSRSTSCRLARSMR